jgi:hypothetical protein
MKIYLYIASIVLLMIPAVGWAQDSTKSIDTVKSAPGIEIESAVDKAEIYIGDLINYRLTITYDSGIVLTPPPIGANLGAFDVKDYQTDEEKHLKDGRIKLESRFKLTTFTTGDYVIPPIPVEYMLPDSTKKILISEPVPIRVKSLLAENADTADIRDIKGPIEFRAKVPWWYYFAGGLLLVLIIMALVWWRIRRGRRVSVEPVDLRPPWEIASERLAILKEKNYPASGEFKLYYIELSEIIRAFLQRVYDLPVLDMTTYEFLTAVVERDIEEQLYNRMKMFLEHADLVKFAKLMPELEKMNNDLEEAIAVVDYIRQTELTRYAIPAPTAPEKETGATDV